IVKGLPTLLEAYRSYRTQIADPWELHCCGAGPLKYLLQDQPGITDHGFTQPADLPARLAAASAFVLPSHYEPWGVVVAEAMGSGLPVIASEACGAAVELVHPLHNGLFTPTGNPTALAAALRWMHDHADELPTLSRHASHAAHAYTASMWADRLQLIMREVSQSQDLPSQHDTQTLQPTQIS